MPQDIEASGQAVESQAYLSGIQDDEAAFEKACKETIAETSQGGAVYPQGSGYGLVSGFHVRCAVLRTQVPHVQHRG